MREELLLGPHNAHLRISIEKELEWKEKKLGESRSKKVTFGKRREREMANFIKFELSPGKGRESHAWAWASIRILCR